MIWLTADAHFGHHNILRYDGRPWPTIEEHDKAIINNINKYVSATDILWDLGDFTLSREVRVWKDLRAAINCRCVHKLYGNHDYIQCENTEIKKLFASTQWTAVLSRSTRKFVHLNHFKMSTWLGARHGSFHCYAHSHQTVAWPKSDIKRRCNVGLPAWNYRPVSLDEIVDLMRSRPFERPRERHES